MDLDADVGQVLPASGFQDCEHPLELRMRELRAPLSPTQQFFNGLLGFFVLFVVKRFLPDRRQSPST